METGKVEYAPDYKSKSRVKRIAAQMGQPFKEFLAEQMRDPEFAETYEAVDIEVDHQRLQAVVVEAARVWWNDGSIDALHGSMSALIAFEAENGIGEGK